MRSVPSHESVKEINAGSAALPKLRLLKPLRQLLGGEAEAGFGAAVGGAIFEEERTAVGFGDLPAKNEADAGPARLRREERDEQVR